MRHFVRQVALALSTFLLAAAAGGDNLVCRLPGIAGKTENGDRAKHFVGATTRDPSKIAIYAEMTPDGAYYHSNFLSEGAENPTKVLSKEGIDPERLLANIIFTSKDAWESSSLDVKQLLRNDVQVQLDKSMFDENGYLLADMSGVKRLQLVDGSQEVSLPTGELRPLTMLRQPPFALTARIRGCCLLGIPPSEARQFARDLEALPFDRSRLKIMNLVRDTRTGEVISRSKELGPLKVGVDVKDLTSVDQVLAEIRAHAGSQMMLIGHVEGSSFVIRRPDNTVQLELPVATLVREADRAGTALALLGCRTAREINHGGSGFGVVESFDSLVAAKILASAVSSSRNHAEFLEAMSSERFNLVIDGKYLASQRRILTAAVMARSPSGSSWRRRVADLLLLLPRGWRGAPTAA